MDGTCSKLIDSVASRGVNMILKSLFHGPWSCLFKLCTKGGLRVYSRRDRSFEVVFAGYSYCLCHLIPHFYPFHVLLRHEQQVTRPIKAKRIRNQMEQYNSCNIAYISRACTRKKETQEQFFEIIINRNPCK